MSAARSSYGPRVSATTMPRSLTPIASQSESHRSGTRIAVRVGVVAIEGQYRPLAKAVHPGNSAQWDRNDYGNSATWEPEPEQQRRIVLLRALPEPLTTLGVVRDIGWSRKCAEYWLGLLSAKGALVVLPNRRGHVWAEGWKR